MNLGAFGLPSKNVPLRKNPFPFIISEGDPMSILQILTHIDRLGTKLGFNSLTAIISAQNNDGGFPRDFQKHSPSSVKITYRVLKTLHRAGIDKESHIMNSALDWLLRKQNIDGGWHENSAIALPKWMTWESTSKSITWYTCQIGKLLQLLQMQNTDTFQRIISFLENSELPAGGWSAVKGLDALDPDSSVGIADFLVQVFGEHHPSFSRARTIFNSKMAKLIAKVQNQKIDDAYELTHLIFENPQNSMYGSEDDKVMTLLKALIEAQRDDGGWLTFYSRGKSDVPITIYSLQVLVSHGVLDKSVPQEMFDAVSED